MIQETSHKALWLSLGENCLPDDILKRHGYKSFSTPYSSGRTNIDYALALEKSNYTDLLNIDNLVYGDARGTKVVRSRHIIEAEDIFDPGCSKGFEFTHHNPIESEKDRDSILRKIQRLQMAKGKNNILFLYHHRYTGKSNLEKLKAKIIDFQKHYTTDKVKCYIALFYQRKIGNLSERRVEHRLPNQALVEFIFHTEHMWGGNDQNIFWARNDDDLIKEMLDFISAYIQSN